MTRLFFALTLLVIVSASYDQDCDNIQLTSGMSRYWFDAGGLARTDILADYYFSDSGGKTYRMNFCGLAWEEECRANGFSTCRYNADGTFDKGLTAWAGLPAAKWSFMTPIFPSAGLKLSSNNSAGVTVDYNIGCNANALNVNESAIVITETPTVPNTHIVISFQSAAACVRPIFVPELMNGVSEELYDMSEVRTYRIHNDAAERNVELDIHLFIEDLHQKQFDIYVKYEEIPTPTAFDFADVSDSSTKTIRITDTDANPLRAGDYYVKIVSPTAIHAHALITASMAPCYQNCSRHGQCAHAIEGPSYCICDEGYGEVDCSVQTTHVELGTPSYGVIRDGSRALFQIDNILPKSYALRVVISDTAHGSDFNTGSGHPYVLVGKNRVPTEDDYDFIVNRPDVMLGNGEWVLNFEAPVMGTWNVMVVSSKDSTYDYSFIAYIDQCPGDCNGHGECDPETNACTCDEGWTGQLDCSELTLDFEPDITAEMKAYSVLPGNWLRFKVNLTSEAYADKVNFLVMVQSHTVYSTFIKFGSPPTESDWEVAGEVPSPPYGLAQQTEVPHQLTQVGEYHVGILNAGTDSIIEVGVYFEGNCPGQCSGKGLCEPKTNKCFCLGFEDFIGSGCEVEGMKFQGGGGRVSSGEVAAIVLFFVAFGFVVGVWTKRKYPDCCGSSSSGDYQQSFDNNEAL